MWRSHTGRKLQRSEEGVAEARELPLTLSLRGERRDSEKPRAFTAGSTASFPVIMMGSERPRSRLGLRQRTQAGRRVQMGLPPGHLAPHPTYLPAQGKGAVPGGWGARDWGRRAAAHGGLRQLVGPKIRTQPQAPEEGAGLTPPGGHSTGLQGCTHVPCGAME